MVVSHIDFVLTDVSLFNSYRCLSGARVGSTHCNQIHLDHGHLPDHQKPGSQDQPKRGLSAGRHIGKIRYRAVLWLLPLNINLLQHFHRTGRAERSPWNCSCDPHRQAHLPQSFPNRPSVLLYYTQLFGIVGVVALLTLVDNGTASGPLLRKPGLEKTGEARR